MTEQTRFDRVLPGLFDELAAARTPEYLEAAIERASSRAQRPAWTHPGRWLPLGIATRAAPVARMPWRQLGVLALIGLLITGAIVAYVGSHPRWPTLPVPLGANGAIALATTDGDILVADRPGGATRPLVTGPEFDRYPMFSPDGAKLAFERQDTRTRDWALMLADADGTNVVQVTTGGWMWSFAPDGRSLMGVRRIDGENRVVLFPVDPGAAPAILGIRLPRSSMDIEAPSFRPSNPQEILVVAQLEPLGPLGLYVYDLATGAIRTIVEPANDLSVSGVAWLPDGEHIIYSGRIVAADGSGDRALDAAIPNVSLLSNDGTRTVAERAMGDSRIDGDSGSLEIVSLNGDREPVALACGPGMKLECATDWIWSPDDSMLIGTVGHESSSIGEVSSYLLADPDTGRVTELDWDGGGKPAWQRVAP